MKRIYGEDKIVILSRTGKLGLGSASMVILTQIHNEPSFIVILITGKAEVTVWHRTTIE
jgi:hypothetical protein